MTDCIFCKIIAKEIDTDLIYEDDKIVVFNDINPKAKIHLLFVPKEHIKSLAEVNTSHADLIFHLTRMLPKVASTQGLVQGFRVIVNTGRGGGQMVDHIHYHLLGGSTLPAL